MTHVRSSTRAISAVVALLAVIAPRASVSAQEHRIEQVAWFTGCWERANGTRRTIERWEAPANGEMKGGSRSFADARETGGERLRLLVDAGKLVYAAHPSTQLPQRFTATAVSGTKATFENQYRLPRSSIP